MKFISLLKYEFLKLYKQEQLPQSFLASLSLSSLCFSLIASAQQINQLAPMLLIIYSYCAIIANCSNLFQEDAKDGTLEFNLLWHGQISIVLAKFLATFFSCLASLALCCAGYWLFFSMKASQTFLLLLCGLIVIAHTIAIGLLISATKIYFNKAKTIAYSMLLPLLIPQTIICGILLENGDFNLLLISIGMLTLCLPLCLFFCAFLLTEASF